MYRNLMSFVLGNDQARLHKLIKAIKDLFGLDYFVYVIEFQK